MGVSIVRGLPVLVAVVGLVSTGVAQAGPIYDTFGPFPEATWGGSGIPNDAAAVSSQFVDGNVVITVAMNATQRRYSNPTVTNDAAGTFLALPGSNFGGNNESATEGGLWNFNYFIKVEGLNGATPVLTDYQITLHYDFDPGEETSLASLGTVNVTNALIGNGLTSTTLLEGSENLLFNWLATPVAGVVSPPAGSFDPNALGEYNFGIQVARNGWGVETVAMDVQVVPEPASALLLGLAGAGMLVRRRR